MAVMVMVAKGFSDCLSCWVKRHYSWENAFHSYLLICYYSFSFSPCFSMSPSVDGSVALVSGSVGRVCHGF